MMSWEAGFIGEMNWKSDVVQSAHTGLISILSLTTENQTFQVGLKGNLCGVSFRVFRCPEEVPLRKKIAMFALSIYGKPTIGGASLFHASLLGLLRCQISAPSHQRVRGSRELPQELGQVCGEGRALCLLITNRNKGRNVPPEPVAQMAGGDRLSACACPPANVGSALPGPLQEGSLPRELFFPEAHLGNGMKMHKPNVFSVPSLYRSC